MSTPFFSIIIPSYNSERFLPRCLGQCRRQTFRGFELVITDDASTDGSVTVIRDFIAANPDISVTFLPSAVNHGIGYSKGLGLRHARGEYVVFHDADDWMDDDFLERGHGVLSANPVDKLRFRIRVLNERTGRVRVRGTTPGTTKWTEGMFHATFFRRAVFTDNGISLSESRDVGEDLYAQVLFNRHCSSFLCV
ncbi:MAG: glycosyltransferase family 2 protein, partial [Treponema sp.]|nr:glycosyltransferase family 2 protein [Treponema sp.]